MQLKRRYLINGWTESREKFLRVIGNITEKEYESLKNGDTIFKDDNSFCIENFDGI